MRIENGTLVMVADGAKMLLLRNKGDADYPNLEVEAGLEQASEPDRDIATDAPGRASSPVGGQASTMEQPDYHQQAEDRFAAEAADLLKERALANDYESLIIVAPPRTLGEMRKHYHGEVEKRLSGEIAKDLTNHPVDQIESIIAGQ